MTLTCECDHGDADWYYIPPDEVKPLDRKRWRKCWSCKHIIRPGDDCAEFYRYRSPANYIEERIHGDEVPMASWFLCDRCFGLYESLDSLGFCIQLNESLIETCREYGRMQREAGVFRGEMVIAKGPA
jgi:hypothetical protein